MVKGLAGLVRSYKAQQKRLSAKHLRSNANKYSVEYEWVRDSYRSAERLEREAEILEGPKRKDYDEF